MFNLIPSSDAGRKAFLDGLQLMALNMNTDTFGTASAESKAKASGMLKAKFSKAFSEINDRVAGKRKALFTMTSADLPVMNTSSFDVVNAGRQYDLDWMLAFRDRPISEGKNFFEIATIENGVQSRLVPEGGKLTFEQLSGSKIIVFVNKYGTGIQWTDEMIRFRDLGAMIDLQEAASEAHYADKADRHYSLLTASSSATTTYQGAGTDTQVERDIMTLNAAYTAHIRANVSKFRGLRANTEVLLYAPIEMQARINRAMKKLIDSTQGSAAILPWAIRPVYTLNNNMPAAQTGEVARCLMVLPERKIQTAQAMAPTFYNEFDAKTLSFIQAGWEYYGSGVGETSQIRTVVFQ